MRTMLLAAATCCFVAPVKAHPIAITDTTVIDPRSGSVRPHYTVVVEGDRIIAVQPASLAVPKRAKRVSGAGKYLMPGLWDAHTHLSKTGEAGLTLFVANGVTGVRDMGSNLDEVAGWKEAIRTGLIVGPRIKYSGPMLEAASNITRMRAQNGIENVDRQRVGLANADEARREVQKLALAGVNQIKMRTSPDLASFEAVADEARRHNLPFAAHPRDPEEMLQARLSSTEHFLTYPPLNLDAAARGALFKRLADQGMRVDNTFVVYQGVTTPYEKGKRILAGDGAIADPRRKYVCGYLLKDWAEQLEEAREGGFGEITANLPAWYRDFREMHEAGVPLLAGSDAAVLFVYPGFSIHDQLELMVRDIGLPAMDVLKIATTGVPDYFGEAHRAGAVAPGQSADLLLLDANPLHDIGATRRVRGVMAQGRWFGRADLNKALHRVERDAVGNCQLGSKAGVRA